MGLFGKKKKEEQKEVKGAGLIESGKGGGTVESISKNNEELQSLLDEFREMRSGIKTEETEDVVHEEIVDDGEEYEVSEEESESIENFLSGADESTEEDEEEIEEADEVLDEEEVEQTEEILDEEEVEDYEEVVDEEIFEDNLDDGSYDSPVDVQVSFNEIPEEEIQDEEILSEEEEFVEDEAGLDEQTEEEIEDEEYVESELEEEFEDEEDIEEFDEEVDEEYSEDEIEDEELVEEVDEEESIEDSFEEEEDESASDLVTSEDLDRKFDDFEKRLLDKLMQQLSMVQMAQPQQSQSSYQSQEGKRSAVNTNENEDLVIETVRGKLVINGFKFSGEVVMFTPIDSVKKASWEEVVRRKGHCTYHLTTSGNGGWFIKKSNAPNPYAYIEKKEEAEELAKIYAEREKAELKIHNAKGVIEKSLSFGREKLRG